MGLICMLRKQITLFRLPPDLYNKKIFKEKSLKQIIFTLKLLLICFLLFLFMLITADIVLFRGLWSADFWRKLLILHAFCVVISVELLLALEYFSKSHRTAAKGFSYFAVFLILFLSAGLTLFNLYISDNIYVYVVVMLVVGFLIPVNPGYFIPVSLVTQALFLFGILAIQMSPNTRVFHQFNSTSAMVIAIIGNIFIYRRRVFDFIKKSQIKMGEDYFRHMIASSPKPLLVSELDNGRILFANKSAQTFFKLNPQDSFWQQSAGDFYTDANEWEYITALLESEQGVVQGYVAEQRTTEDEHKWTIAYYTNIEYLGKKAVLCEYTDITPLKQKELSLIISASSDPLTGILNRRKGMELLHKAIRNAQDVDVPFVLCFIDIDGLKNINDTYGHAEGDAVIISLCRIIQGFLNKEDVLYRYGGDEFVILFINKTLSKAEEIYGQIYKDFERYSIDEFPAPVSISSGFCECRAGENISPEEVLDKADREMYKQKRKRL